MWEPTARNASEQVDIPAVMAPETYGSALHERLNTLVRCLAHQHGDPFPLGVIEETQEAPTGCKIDPGGWNIRAKDPLAGCTTHPERREKPAIYRRKSHTCE
jgi:hypothetical protein